jgi:dihydrofolate synthase/folylpolyglutamate synthase
VDADVALLTSVGLDHQDWLGNDREKIGREKAGVFRPGRPAICAEQNPPDSVLAYAKEIQARCLLRDQDYSLTQAQACWSWQGPDNVSRYSLPMPALRGGKQVDNAAAVVMVIESLSDRLPVSQTHLRQGLLDVRLPGRFQVVAGRIPVILDVAHNPQAAEVLSHTLREFACHGRVLAVLGMKQDKDAAVVARYLQSQVAEWYLGPLDTPLGLSADTLASKLQSQGISGLHIEDTITSAFDQAMTAAREGDCILVFGSFYTVAEILAHLSLSV